MRERLFTPGPVEVPSEALQAESLPLIHHRTPEFRAEIRKAFEGLNYVFQTPDPVLILACSGSGAMEAALFNLVSPGDRILVVRGGKFADRWLSLGKACGADPVGLDVEWGHSVDPESVRAKLKADRGIKAVFATHSETSTGARHDVRALASVTREFDVPLAIDAITSLAAMELRPREWGIDVVVGGSQKGFMMAPGLGFVSVSERARKLAAECRTPRFYFDFNRALKSVVDGDTPFTPAISLVRSLLATLGLIRAEGLENVWLRHARNAAATRAAMQALGLTIFPQHPTDSVTTVNAPEGIVSDELIKAVLQRHGMRMANGQDQLKGKTFRIGHLGAYRPADVLAIVGAVEDSLASLGYKLTPGAGLSAAQTVFAAPAPAPAPVSAGAGS